jgi:cytochrome b
MNTQCVRVWDLPTRVFHWLFALSFVVAFITHDADRYLDIHVFAGYVFFALLIFRLVWGIIGSKYARFHSFFFSIGETVAYLRGLLQGRPTHYLGHNPAGSWAIFLLLGLGAVVAISGLATLGIEEGHGPLATFFNPEKGELWEEVHEVVSFVMLFVIFIHIAGVVVSSVLHKENLARAMVTGNKQCDDTALAVKKHPLIAILMVVVFFASMGWYFQGYATTENYRPFKGPQLANNETWRTECGACHVAYHPTLLPARSWNMLLDDQANHFGEDLYLDTDLVGELRDFHIAHAAETQQTEAAYKILRSIPANETPLRISATVYWQHKHEEIDETVWQSDAVNSRANCNACHLDAEQGTYKDAAMRIPTT